MSAELVIGALALAALASRGGAASGGAAVSGRPAAPGGGRWRALERPGGGRIQDKRAPPASELVNVTGVGGKALQAQRDAWNAYLAMREVAYSAGVERRLLGVHSALRSTARQRELFEDKVAQVMRADPRLSRAAAEEVADDWVARPGGSAHESGRAFDLDLDGGEIAGSRIEAMKRSTAWQWLARNAVRFGFYPYPLEPWHWEYNPPA